MEDEIIEPIQSTTAGDDAVIPAGETDISNSGADNAPGEESTVLDGKQITTEDQPAGADTPAVKLSLSEIVEKNLKEREEKGEDLVPEKKDEIEQPGETDETADPKKTPDEKTATENEKVEDAADKPEDLKIEDVDKVHAKDSVSARERIKLLAGKRDELQARVEELESREPVAGDAADPELVEAFEVVGGKDGLNEILNKIEIIENPEKAAEFIALVEASPNFEEFKTKHFWSELDNEANQKMIVQDQFGEDWTIERLKKTVDFVNRGLINLDEIEDRDDAFKLSDDELDKKRSDRSEAEKLREENAKLKAEEQKRADEAAQVEISNRWSSFSQNYDEALFPILEDLGVLPLADDAPEIVEAKMTHWQKIVAASQTEYAKNPDFQTIAKLINDGKTETVTFRNKARAFKPAYLDIAKRAALAELPFLTGTLDAIYLKQGAAKTSPPSSPKSPAKENKAAAPPPVETPKSEPTADLNTAPPVSSQVNLSDRNERQSAFQRAVSRSSQSRR